MSVNNLDNFWKEIRGGDGKISYFNTKVYLFYNYIDILDWYYSL